MRRDARGLRSPRVVDSSGDQEAEPGVARQSKPVPRRASIDRIPRFRRISLPELAHLSTTRTRRKETGSRGRSPRFFRCVSSVCPAATNHTGWCVHPLACVPSRVPDVSCPRVTSVQKCVDAATKSLPFKTTDEDVPPGRSTVG